MVDRQAWVKWYINPYYFGQTRRLDSPTDTWRFRMLQDLTAIITREGDLYVALCPELDIASQGKNVTEARANLQEALELFFEEAPDEEVQRRAAMAPRCPRIL